MGILKLNEQAKKANNKAGVASNGYAMSSDTSDDTSASGAESSSGDEITQLTICAYSDSVAIMNKAIESWQMNGEEWTFEVSAPNVEYNELSNWLMTHLNSGGEMFDIIYNNYEIFNTIRNYLGKEYLANSDVSQFPVEYFEFEVARLTDENNGYIYGVPYASSIVGLYYNRTILDECGIDICELEHLTWDNFIEIAKEIKALYPDIYVLPPLTSETVRILVQSLDTQYFDEESKLLHEEGAKAIFEILQALKDNDLIPPIYENYYEVLENNINSNKCAFVIDCPWIYKKILNCVQEGSNWGVCRIPTSEKFTNQVSLGGSSWLVMQNGNEEKAFDFLTQMFGGLDDLAHFIAEKNYVPAWRCNLNDLEYDSDVFSVNVIGFLNSLGNEVASFDFYEYLERLNENIFSDRRTFFDISQELIYGQIDASLAIILYSELYTPPRGKELKSIEIITPPDKTEYYEYEYFDPKGMVIKIIYSDGTQDTVNYNSGSNIVLKQTDKYVKISYTYNNVTKTTNQPVLVQMRNITSIQVKCRQYYFQGDKLTNSDFEVCAIYDKGPSRRIYDFNITPDIAILKQTQYITIEYQGFEYGLNIDAYPKLNSISIKQKPEKLLYYENNRIERTGMKVIAYYSDGTGKYLSNGSLYISPKTAKFNNGETESAVKVTYTERGVTESAAFKVYKQTGAELDNCDITQDMGASGTGSINLSSGQFTYKFEDFSGTNAYMPINISRVYKGDMVNKYVGKGWRLNLQQEIELIDGNYVYTDKEGDKYTFDEGFTEECGRSSIRNEKSGLDLFTNGDSEIRLIDRSNNSLIFAKVGTVYKLTEMHQYPSTPDKVIDAYSIKIKYDGNGRISEVLAGKTVEGSRPKAIFNYGSYLNSIEYELGSILTVVRYAYDGNGDLTSITRLNNEVTESYAAKTYFEWDGNSFIVKDLSSKDGNGNYKSLKYEFMDGRVSKFSIGYGESERENSTVSYTKLIKADTGAVAETNEDYLNVIASTIIEHKNTISVVCFNKFASVSQFSYELATADDYKKPKRVLYANSYGFDYKSLADSYSDTLDIYRGNFANSTDGWEGGTQNSTHSINGGNSIKGKILTKYYNYKPAQADGETLYVSLWVYANSDFTISLNNIERKFTNNLNEMWQYIVFPLGRIKGNVNIAISVKSDPNAYGSYVCADGVRITKAPYEMPDNIPEAVLNTFGNAEKSYRYNPVDKKTTCTEYEYNDKQQIIKETVTVNGGQNSSTAFAYNSDGLLTSVKRYGKMSQKYIEQISGYNGYVQSSYSDENDSETKYSEGVDYTQTETVGETGSPTATVKNTYYGISDFLKIVSSTNGSNEMTYNADGSLKQATSGTDINFVYDTFGNVESVKIGETPLVEYAYDWKHLKGITYANGGTVVYEYDANDRVTSITENGTTPISITYGDDAEETVTVTNGNGVVYESKKVNKNGVTGEYRVKFPEDDNEFKVQSCAKNGAGNVRTEKTYFGSETVPFESCVTTANRDGQVTKRERSGHGASVTYSYDGLNRLEAKAAGFNSAVYTVTYGYSTISGDRVSTRVESESLRIGLTQKDGYSYTYYNNGNLKAIKSGTEIKASYEYDSNNRLIRENNYGLGYSYTYDYDDYGNITSRTQYKITDGNIINTDSYEYEDGVWRDKLTSYNRNEISYDALGNPTRYRGKTLSWRGRKLINADGVSMEYDYNGLRLRKGNKRYYWQGETLKAEVWDNNYIYYYYDESGVSGMCYNGTEYYFRKNILGDVIAIYDVNGNRVCYYYYNAFGEHKVEGNTVIGNLNPFRYRGYYYDEELGLYYLQSRYYDPKVGRFISADDVSYLDPESIFGLNLYAYCNNNPVMYTDPTGELALLLIFLGITTIIGGVVGAVKAAETGKEGWDFAKSVLIGSAVGLAVGGAIASIFGVIGGAVSGATATFGGMAFKQIFALGAVAFNTSAFLFGPLLGFKMEGIDFETPKPIYTPPVLNPLPPHPSQNNRRYK